MNGTNVLKGLVTLAVAMTAATAGAADVGFGLNVNIGNMPPAVVLPAPPPLVVSAPPAFIVPPSLGISIAVGVPYDMFMVSGSYYMYKGNRWYCGPRYGGPWRPVARGHLPHELRGHDIEHFRHLRDREYAAYNRDRGHYRGRYFQAGRDERGRGHGRGGEQVAWSEGGRGEGRGHGEGSGRGEGRGEGRSEGRGHGGGHGRD